ncbi:MAG: metalloregulator ArsR/SmtB family transcription factor [Paracoccaceae bacterium]
MSDLTTHFAALGDPVRFAIVERLLSTGEQSAGELLDVADVSAPAISRHLKVLREAGLITRRIDAQRRIYSVEPSAIGMIGAWTMSHRDFWEAGLDRLAAALDNEE